MEPELILTDDMVLVTGSAGFLGSRVVAALVDRGFRNIRCLVRPSSDPSKIAALKDLATAERRVEVVVGNLLSRQDCAVAVRGAVLIYHLAAGRGEKSFADAFLNSVVTTRNLLDAARDEGMLRRFVTLSTFSVYTNCQKRTGRMLDETCQVEDRPQLRGDAYTFAKTKQDQLVVDYGKRFNIPYVIVRPGVVYGPGNESITGRAGIGSFGLFLHMGGANEMPLTYVDNCADAVVLAGVKPGIEGEVFNVVDDQLLSSRQFLRLYKKNVRRFNSIYLPHVVSYCLCWLWEKYAQWSHNQIPHVFNRRIWHAYWKKTSYTNARAKTRLGWNPRVSLSEALQRYFESCRTKFSESAS
jgi:nucleoside-diphosphate-sugar epimerase